MLGPIFQLGTFSRAKYEQKFLVEQWSRVSDHCVAKIELNYLSSNKSRARTVCFELKSSCSLIADTRWAPFTALRYRELRLLNSARAVGLHRSLRLTNSVKH